MLVGCPLSSEEKGSPTTKGECLLGDDRREVSGGMYQKYAKKSLTVGLRERVRRKKKA